MPKEFTSEPNAQESAVIAGRNAVTEALKKARPIDCIYILKGADRGSGYPVLRGHGLCALQLRAGPGRGEPQILYALLRRLRLGALRAHALAFCAAIFQFCCQMAVQSGPTGAQVLVKTPKNQIFSKKYLPKNSHKVYNDEKPPRAVPPRRNKPRRGWPR